MTENTTPDATADEADLPELDYETVAWYTPETDGMLADPRSGDVVTVRTFHGDHRMSMRLDGDPFTRVAYHSRVDRTIYGRYEWLEFQFAFGVKVFNHAKWRLDSPKPESDWREYPTYAPELAARPVALVWRIEPEGRGSRALHILGERGQDQDQFRAQVLANLPEPYTREERLVMRRGEPIKVVVAASPHPDVEQGIAELTDPRGWFIVYRAETVEQLMGLIGHADVVITESVLPSSEDGKLADMCGPFGLIRERKLSEQAGFIGAPMDIHRRWRAHRATSDDYGHVMMHVTATCGGRNIFDPECQYRHIVDLVLDAAGLPVTKPAGAIPATV